MRYVSNRYADEDRTLTAQRFTLFDVGARYRYKLSTSVALDAFVTIENLANVEWREAQFATTSRLQGEPPQGVTEVNSRRATRAPSSAASRSDSDTVRAT